MRKKCSRWQVHPSDQQTNYIPVGEHGKTEAWVVLEAGHKSRIYAGLKPGATADRFTSGNYKWQSGRHLAYFTPKPGDAIFLPAGTVHTLGGDIVVFEVQENSDVTFRLYDWNHVDAKTGKPRALQVDQALACIDFTQAEQNHRICNRDDNSVQRERIFQCDIFTYGD